MTHGECFICHNPLSVGRQPTHGSCKIQSTPRVGERSIALGAGDGVTFGAGVGFGKMGLANAAAHGRILRSTISTREQR